MGLTRSDMHGYQVFGVERIVQQPATGLFLGMGMGKTCTTLTALDDLLFDSFEVSKPLIIAPKRVAQSTWSDEIEAWSHLKHLTISKIIGTEKQRLKALQTKADVYVIGRDNVAWLVSRYRSGFPFDMLVIDESSSFKNPSSKRFKALKLIRPLVSRVVILTGTPAPNGYLDLWSQIYLLDRGERLGATFTAYKDSYFKPAKRNGHIVYSYDLKAKDGKEQILNQINDICVSMKAADYLELKPRVDKITWVTLSDANMKRYNEFEASLVLNIADKEITALNAASLMTKLRQFANGAVYDEYRGRHIVHDEKLEALAEEIEAANGENVLLFYQFRHDLERILERFKHEGVREFKNSNDLQDWNEGKIKILVTHAASAGHGLNMQHGGHILIWFGLDFGSELYEQGCARLDRQGQKFPVINSRLLCKGTVDELVLKKLESKIDDQNGLLEALKIIIKKHTH